MGGCAGVHVDEPDGGLDLGILTTVRDGSPPTVCGTTSECDDNSVCTVDSCQQGYCAHTPVKVDDGDPCTTDTCHPIDGIRHNPVNVDDQDACTIDSCAAGGISHVAKTCPSDGNACTKDACVPQTGMCASTPITACANNDGCCPSGCTMANDNDCNCTVNLATGATPTESAGSVSSSYGPQNLNDGIRQNACTYFAWVTNTSTPGTAFFQYAWTQPQTINSIYVETGIGSCSSTPGRAIGSARVEWWDGATWQLSTTVTGKSDDFQLDLPSPVTTTRLRLYAVAASGGSNTLIHEWFVFTGKGCVP